MIFIVILLAQIGCTKELHRVIIIFDFSAQGGYSEWSEWSECTKSCGVGKKNRTRNCTNPSPANGGLSCANQGFGDAEETVACMQGLCPSECKLTLGDFLLG